MTCAILARFRNNTFFSLSFVRSPLSLYVHVMSIVNLANQLIRLYISLFILVLPQPMNFHRYSSQIIVNNPKLSLFLVRSISLSLHFYLLLRLPSNTCLLTKYHTIHRPLPNMPIFDSSRKWPPRQLMPLLQHYTLNLVIRQVH